MTLIGDRRNRRDRTESPESERQASRRFARMIADQERATGKSAGATQNPKIEHERED
jgi:hypothetical protein